jgi:dolichol-phosphate mannosyltransferase
VTRRRRRITIATVTPSSGTADRASSADWPPGRVLVVAATYQERGNVERLVDRVLAAGPELQLLIVDDDSPDGTAAAALNLAESESRLHVLVRRGRRGLGGAILEGFALAQQHGFEVAVNLDADMSHDPDDIPRLLAALEPAGGRPADVVVGSRRVPGGRTLGWPLIRHVVSRLVGWFTRFVVGVPVRDASSGFRAVRLATFAAAAGSYATGYTFLEEMLWRMHRAGGRIVEVPITFTNRERGSSKAGLRESVVGGWRLLQLAATARLGG